MQPELHELHHELEDSHWWFTARREIVLSQLTASLRRDHATAEPLRLLDVGCGSGGMLRHLASFGAVVGVDPAPAAVAYAAASGLDVRPGSLPDALPFDAGDRFDVITLLDVLEHVADDAAALDTLRGLLHPHGRLIITVPALQALWSSHDVVNEHHRRYGRRQLADRLRGAGFTIERLSFFNSALFPAIAAVRLLRRVTGRDSAAGADLGVVREPLNSLLHGLFAAERHVLRKASLPIGVSLIAVARPGTGHGVSR